MGHQLSLTDTDREEMLAAIGVSSIEELFKDIPAGVRWISHVVWGRYYIEVVRDALLQGGGWPAVWHKVAIIALTGSIFYTAAWRVMRRMQLRT